MKKQKLKAACMIILACAAALFLWTTVLALHVRPRNRHPRRESLRFDFFQRLLEEREKAFNLSPQQVQDEYAERPQMWVLVGSTARSGTSLIGELMSKTKPSIYFFEPELFVRASSGNLVMKENGVPFLEAVGECRFDEAFIEWLHTRSKGNVVRHKMTGRCRTSTQCFTMDTLTEACRSEHLRIMKVIRFRIRWMRELLSSSKFDFKLVHLIRDPRASLRSMYSHHLTKLQPDYYCPLIEDDLNQIKELESEFPGQVLKLKYESFCLDPEGQSSKLWRFLSGNQTASLPPEWTAFLEKHTHKKSNHIDPVYGTVRDTRDEYLAWRWEIHEDLLADVEKYCASAIHNLGYNLFGTIDVARNKSVPLFLEDL